MKNPNKNSFNQKRPQRISVSLTYKPSQAINFRLSKALETILSEEDLRKYFVNNNNDGDTKDDTNK